MLLLLITGFSFVSKALGFGWGYVHWPAGSYGIPRAASGCPSDYGFDWLVGQRKQHTEDTDPQNYQSPEFHLNATVYKSAVLRSFCLKTDTSAYENRTSWPRGQYCIYRKGGACPIRLASGFIKWDDEDTNNENTKSGPLPDGIFDFNTKIEFCCRTDGDKTEPISLPAVKPFFLLAYDSAECQMVKWAVSSVEWIGFDNEDFNNQDSKGGAHPFSKGKSVLTVYYCYYQGCNETLTASSGTFHSPNYPRKYPDGQYCSWKITVSRGQHIHLMFTNFSLQNEKNTDSLYVYDGVNEAAKVLGVFYGGHLPAEEGIYSSTNNVFVIFKSDGTESYTGFNASYFAKAIPKPGTPTRPRTGLGPFYIAGITVAGILIGISLLVGICFHYRRKRALHARQQRTAEVRDRAPFENALQTYAEVAQTSVQTERHELERPPAYNPDVAVVGPYPPLEHIQEVLPNPSTPPINLAPNAQDHSVPAPSAPPESALY